MQDTRSFSNVNFLRNFPLDACTLEYKYMIFFSKGFESMMGHYILRRIVLVRVLVQYE